MIGINTIWAKKWSALFKEEGTFSPLTLPCTYYPNIFQALFFSEGIQRNVVHKFPNKAKHGLNDGYGTSGNTGTDVHREHSFQ